MSTGQKRPPPPAKRAASPSPEATASPNRFAILSGRISGPQRIVVYGPGGIGKTSLAALAPNPVFLDIESGTRALDVPRVEGIDSFQDLRACLQSDVLDGFESIVLDSATRAEELSIAHTIATVPHEKGHRVKSIEGYGFSKGLAHNYDTFLTLLMDLDRQIRGGRNVILIAHDCTADVPNPTGDDFIRFEPHLQAPKSGKNSIRNRVIQWADHVLFVGYDVIAEDGKGKGAGTRTIWPIERPDHVAKSRTLAEPMPFDAADDGAIWPLIFGGVK